MTDKLTRELLKLAKTHNNAVTTNSSYYEIGCIKVRVSDHQGPLNHCDLAVYPVSKGYTVIPQIGVCYKVNFFTSVKSLMEYIKQFEYFASIFVKPGVYMKQPEPVQVPVQVPEVKPATPEKTVVISAFEKSYYWTHLQFNWASPRHPELEPLVHQLFAKTPRTSWDSLIALLKKQGPLTMCQKINFIKQRL